ncbi:MAG: patatin-like phospholipase family protein, partial [Spirochaetota bacterium]
MGKKRFLCLLIVVCVVFPLAAESRDEAPTVGLVLSGGAALGFAHIGVLKVIEDVGIPIDYVVGTSMGGLVGGLYAAGYSP